MKSLKLIFTYQFSHKISSFSFFKPTEPPLANSSPPLISYKLEDLNEDELLDELMNDDIFDKYKTKRMEEMKE